MTIHRKEEIFGVQEAGEYYGWIPGHGDHEHSDHADVH